MFKMTERFFFLEFYIFKYVLQTVTRVIIAEYLVCDY